MIDYKSLLESLRDTLNRDNTLSGYLKEKGGEGRVVLGPDIPAHLLPQFITIYVLSNNQDIEGAKEEFTVIGLTIYVRKAITGMFDYQTTSNITRRIAVLFDDQLGAMTLPNDTAAHFSREGGLPPSVESIGDAGVNYLVTQDRYQLMSFTN